MKRALSFLLILLLLGSLTGCGKAPTALSPESADLPDTVTPDFAADEGEMFTRRDCDPTYEQAVQVTLTGSTATATGDGVEIKGSTVTLTKEGTYRLSGKLEGTVLVDAPDTAKLQLVLEGAQITNSTSAPLYIRGGDKVFVTLAEGSVNTLTSGDSFVAIDDNNIDGALFSKQDLTLNGSGALTVTAPAGHGIVCKDDLVITGGTYVINAACHGVDANDSLRLKGASLTVDAGKDILHAENNDDASLGFIYIAGGTVKGEGEGDGIAAGAHLQITDGTFDLLVGGGSENGSKAQSDNFGGFMGGGPGGMRPGGRGGANVTNTATTTTEESGTSMKGLKAGAGMLISGGTFTVNSADDALHSDTDLTVSGGTFTLATGDDALHAEETLTVTGGKIEISESYEGLEALHLDLQGGEIKLVATDDGLNAAGGNDQSGFTGGRDGMFGGLGGGMGGGMSANSDGSIKVSGGTLYINSSGDGIDANGTLEITDGHVTVVGPTRGDTATLDYDLSATIAGGTFIGTGASGMAQTFSDSTQGVISVSVGNPAAGTTLQLKDKSGAVLLEHTPELDFAVLIFSSPKIKKGETYTLTVGTDSADVTAG